ncbi:MAG: hypothetical protein R2911_20755 [Caldilineaceae bacterium]
MLAKNYRAGDLADLGQSGELFLVTLYGIDPRRARVRFFFRGEGGAALEPATLAADLSGR